MIPVKDYNFTLKTKSDMIKLHLLMRCLDLGHYPEQSELSVLEHLYNSNGISSKKENNDFIRYCVDNKLRGSEQSVRNVLSVYTDIGLLVKPKNCVRHFKDGLLPELPEIFVLKYFVTNLPYASQTK